KDRLDDIAEITISTQKWVLRGVNKTGPLPNSAYRDHSVQYIVAVGLIQSKLNASDFEDEFAADPRIDPLRDKMTLIEDARYTREHMDPDKRSIANAIEIRFKDGSTLPKMEVEYPLGHPRRRADGIPALEGKFAASIGRRFPPKQQQAI